MTAPKLDFNWMMIEARKRNEPIFDKHHFLFSAPVHPCATHLPVLLSIEIFGRTLPFRQIDHFLDQMMPLKCAVRVLWNEFTLHFECVWHVSGIYWMIRWNGKYSLWDGFFSSWLIIERLLSRLFLHLSTMHRRKTHNGKAIGGREWTLGKTISLNHSSLAAQAIQSISF